MNKSLFSVNIFHHGYLLSFSSWGYRDPRTAQKSKKNNIKGIVIIILMIRFASPLQTMKVLRITKKEYYFLAVCM